MATILASTPAAVGQQPNVLYLSTFAGIDRSGVSSSNTGFMNAIAYCAGNSITLVVDCAIRLVIGYNNNLPIFIPSFLNVDFTPSGIIYVDNVFVPAFCFLHTTDCTWNNAHIQYVGSFPLDLNGAWNQSQVSFNNINVKNYLTANFGMTYSNNTNPQYNPNSSAMALLSFRGANQRLVFNNLVLDVPAGALATQFIPFGIGLASEWLPNSTVSNNYAAATSLNTAVPQDITINNLIMDGFLMGIQGAGSITLNSPIFKRYSDLQDSSYVSNEVGANQGGINSTHSPGTAGYADWFPSPHAISIRTVDPSLTCTKVINSGFDYGIYVGGTTRRASTSGSMTSLKISPQFGTRINGFKSLRADGIIEIDSYNTASGGAELNDLVAAAYDSSLVHADAGYLPAVSFIDLNPYTYLTINRLSITDVAVQPVVWAISADNYAGNYNLEINDLQYRLNDFPANGWGFNLQGKNVRITGDVYLQNCTSTKTGVGLISSSISSSVATLGPITGGSGYTNGTYTNVILSSKTGTGSSSAATLVITGGAVTSVTLTDPGYGYNIGDILSIGAAMTVGTITGGTGYTAGTYTNVPLTSSTGNGLGAKATITVSGGAVTAVSITANGSGYALGNNLSALASNIGGTGSGFFVPVATLDITNSTYSGIGTAGTGFSVSVASLLPNVTNAYCNLRLWGWRIINNLTFTTVPSGTSATLTSNWAFPTDTYTVKFPSGQMRSVSLILGSTLASWNVALPAAEASTSFVISCITSSNINSYRDTLTFNGSLVNGIYSYVKDMSNGITIENDSGVITETWSQYYSGSPIGATQATTITFPSTYAIDRVGCAVATTLGTVSSFGVGWNGTPTALLSNQSTSSASNVATPNDNTWPKSLAGSARNILLTPTSNSFDGTGVLRLTVRGTRMYGAG